MVSESQKERRSVQIKKKKGLNKLFPANGSCWSDHRAPSSEVTFLSPTSPQGAPRPPPRGNNQHKHDRQPPSQPFKAAVRVPSMTQLKRLDRHLPGPERRQRPSVSDVRHPPRPTSRGASSAHRETAQMHWHGLHTSTGTPQWD